MAELHETVADRLAQLGPALRELRVALGLTIQDCEDGVIGLTTTAHHMIEAGKRQTPRVDSVLSIMIGLGRVLAERRKEAGIEPAMMEQMLALPEGHLSLLEDGRLLDTTTIQLVAAFLLQHQKFKRQEQERARFKEEARARREAKKAKKLAA